MQEKLGEKLQKQEEKELEKVKQLVQDLQDKQFRCVQLITIICLCNEQIYVLCHAFDILVLTE